MLLVEPVIPRLRRYARALLRDENAADDLVQDCLERAIARWHQRRDDGDARSWLFAILHNLAINHLRQASRRGRVVPVEEAGPGTLARPPEQETAIHRADIMAALDRLSEDQRSVLLLVGVEDFAYADAARVLDIPVGTVMSRLSRGRARLREELAGWPAAVPYLRRVK